MKVAIIGLGLIGASAALALEARGWDRDPGARRQARARGIETVDELQSAVDGATVVLLAVPSGEVPAALELVASLASSALLTDAASWKRPGIQAATRLPAATRYVGGHPMAGAAASGAAAARADLFTGRPWLLVPTARSDEASIETVAALVRTTGAIPRVVTADAHDEAMTWVSHLPLAVAASLSRAVARERAGTANLAGPGLQDTTRLADTPESLALELALADPQRLAEAVDQVCKEANALAESLRAGDREAVKRFFEDARRARSALGIEPSITRSPD